MNPTLVEMVAQAKVADSLRAAAKRARSASRGAARGRRAAAHPGVTGPASVRTVIGRTLVNVGLRLGQPQPARGPLGDSGITNRCS